MFNQLVLLLPTSDWNNIYRSSQLVAQSNILLMSISYKSCYYLLVNQLLISVINLLPI